MRAGGPGLGLGLGFGAVERVRLLAVIVLLEDDDIGRSCNGVSGTSAEVKEVKR